MMTAPLIFYQIYVELKLEVVDDYAAWLHGHVAEILALPWNGSMVGSRPAAGCS